MLFIALCECAIPHLFSVPTCFLYQYCGLGYEQAEEAARKAAEDKRRAELESAAAKKEAEAAAAQAGQQQAEGLQSAEASSGRASSLRVALGAAEAEKQCWETLKAGGVRARIYSLACMNGVCQSSAPHTPVRLRGCDNGI